MTCLGQMQLYIANGCALDGLWGRFDHAFYKNDALVLYTGSPLQHLLADLLRSDNEQCLNGIGALTEIEENHFIALCSRSLHSSTKQDSLSI